MKWLCLSNSDPCDNCPTNSTSCVPHTPSDGGVDCVCPLSYNGTNCEVFIGCDDDPCMNNGSCTDDVDSFTCHCPRPWTGFLCDADIDDCILVLTVLMDIALIWSMTSCVGVMKDMREGIVRMKLISVHQILATMRIVKI